LLDKHSSQTPLRVRNSDATVWLRGFKIYHDRKNRTEGKRTREREDERLAMEKQAALTAQQQFAMQDVNTVQMSTQLQLITGPWTN
jgi:hypothetical protein